MRILPTFFSTLTLLFCLNGLAVTEVSPEQRDDIQAFIQEMVQKNHFQASELNALFKKVELKPRILKTIKNPKEKETWGHYKNLFLKEKRIKEGRDFAKTYQATLTKAEQEFGVPKNIILGILGVETFYGSRQGQHRVLDALATLAFNYKNRAKFFRSELEAFLIMTRKNHLDPLSLKGSYAGAMGYPQFMPSSYLDYAVDYSNTGDIDLIHDPIDAIGSIAHYLAKKGHWKQNEPILEKLNQTRPEGLALGRHPMKRLYQYGIQTKTPHAGNIIVQLFEVEQDGKTELYLGYPNFKAIMSYNPRINYAMAVYHLGQAIEQEVFTTKVLPISAASSQDGQ